MTTDEREAREAAYQAAAQIAYKFGWPTPLDSAVYAAVDAYKAHLAGKVQDGWQLVPKEPTREMLDVAVSFALCVSICGEYNWSAYMRDVYSRMLAAAPSPAGETRGSSDPSIVRDLRHQAKRLEEAYSEGKTLPNGRISFALVAPNLMRDVILDAADILEDATPQPNAEGDVKRVKGVLSGAMWNYWENNEFHPDSYADMLTEALASAGLLRSRYAVLEDEVVKVLEPFAFLAHEMDAVEAGKHPQFGGEFDPEWCRTARDLLTRIRQSTEKE